MPDLPRTPCLHPGCGELVRSGRCPVHQQQRDREVEARRQGSAARGYTWRWRKESALFLRAHPVCECDECRAAKRVRVAEVVDHRVPHKGDRALFWNRENWQAMSKACHDAKTAREDGGFGRPVVSKRGG